MDYQISRWTTKFHVLEIHLGYRNFFYPEVIYSHWQRPIRDTVIHVGFIHSVFQLGRFLRALRPARTALRLARLSSALRKLFT